MVSQSKIGYILLSKMVWDLTERNDLRNKLIQLKLYGKVQNSFFNFFPLFLMWNAVKLSTLGKNFSSQHFEILFYFFQKIGLDISCKL